MGDDLKLIKDAQKATGTKKEEPSPCADCVNEHAPEIRVVPNIQFSMHLGIFSYLEKVDGSSLPDSKTLYVGGTENNVKWITPDRKRIYFVPRKGMTYASEAYLNGKGFLLEKKIFTAATNRECIEAMKEQMRVFAEFRDAYRHKPSEDYTYAIECAYNRYWKILDYLENKNLSQDDDEYLLTVIKQVGEYYE